MLVRHVPPAVTLVLTVLLGACVPSGPRTDASSSPAARPPADDAPLVDGRPDDEGASRERPEALGRSGGYEDPTARPPTICERVDLDEIDAVIARQLDAFAAGDWEAALDLASSDVREAVDAEAFEVLIEERHPVAANGAEHRSQTCVTPRPGIAELRVVLIGADGERADVRYHLVDEAGWRVADATTVAVRDPDATTV